jgi:hypothetical protein
MTVYLDTHHCHAPRLTHIWHNHPVLGYSPVHWLAPAGAWLLSCQSVLTTLAALATGRCRRLQVAKRARPATFLLVFVARPSRAARSHFLLYQAALALPLRSVLCVFCVRTLCCHCLCSGAVFVSCHSVFYVPLGPRVSHTLPRSALLCWGSGFCFLPCHR